MDYLSILLFIHSYMLSTTVIGITYTLLQTAFAIFQVSTGKRFGGAALCYLDFYGDKVCLVSCMKPSIRNRGVSERIVCMGRKIERQLMIADGMLLN